MGKCVYAQNVYSPALPYLKSKHTWSGWGVHECEHEMHEYMMFGTLRCVSVCMHYANGRVCSCTVQRHTHMWLSGCRVFSYLCCVQLEVVTMFLPCREIVLNGYISMCLTKVTSSNVDVFCMPMCATCLLHVGCAHLSCMSYIRMLLPEVCDQLGAC